MIRPGGALRRVRPEDVERHLRPPVDPDIEQQAAAIVERVRVGGEDALRSFATRFGDLDEGTGLTVGPDGCTAALGRIGRERAEALERVAERIRTFAEAQRDAIHAIEIPIPGGVAGHRIDPVERAGCYARADDSPCLLPS